MIIQTIMISNEAIYWARKMYAENKRLNKILKDDDMFDTFMHSGEKIKKLEAENAELQETIEHYHKGYISRGLTLATLCDMVLGEDAEDRSDDALIRAVGMLFRGVQEKPL